MERIAHTIAEASAFLGIGPGAVRARIKSGTLACLDLSPRLLRVALGDIGHSCAHEHPLRSAFHGCRTVDLRRLADALHVHRSTLRAMAAAGDLPTFRTKRGKLRCWRNQLVTWLWSKRRPCRWERAA